EKELPRIAEGQLAYVRIDAAEGQEFKARVRRVNPNVDAATGTVKVMLDFDAVDKEKLRDAAFARVRLVMDTRSQVLAVPKDAVLEDNARNYVMVAEPADSSVDTEQTGSNDTGNMAVYIARKVEVETGLDDGDYIEITKGLDENASVIVMGQHTLKPDSLVTITTADKEIADRQDISLDEALARAKKKQEEEEQKKRAEQEALNQQQ
ncbi:MAG TPA: efflux RND transporter periplasmic adaptor subunit, partial [Candidatus Hydrogenedentes bacterium]|nr:efflux RND transporter periplasmic adaptor subunit [Candidatus Hydrogenedentota bacterium]